jgi:hypothetical protein
MPVSKDKSRLMVTMGNDTLGDVDFLCDVLGRTRSAFVEDCVQARLVLWMHMREQGIKPKDNEKLVRYLIKRGYLDKGALDELGLFEDDKRGLPS